MVTRLPLVAAVTAAVAMTTAPPTDARSLTITPGKYGVTKIGSFKTVNTRRYAPTPGRAARAIGRPSSRFQKHGGCVMKWARYGLRIEFHNFGGVPAGETVCGDDGSYAQSFTAKGRQVRTWKGLRPGMTEDALLDRHRSAEWFEGDRYRAESWWLRQQYSPYGDGGLYPIVAARVRGGRVSSLDGWIGAAGE